MAARLPSGIELVDLFDLTCRRQLRRDVFIRLGPHSLPCVLRSSAPLSWQHSSAAQI
jgi:hypothetical protein